jgi:hypothetical protein
MSIQYKLKQEKGVLHVGGGRFFYPGETYDLTDVEAVTYGHYFSEEQAAVVEEDEELGDNKDHDNDKIEDVVITEMATDKTENIDDVVETEAEAKAEQEPSRNRRKPSSEKAEK